MALIKCTECGKIFSDKAAYCPNCGCPTEVVKKELDILLEATPNVLNKLDDFQKSILDTDNQQKHKLTIIHDQLQQVVANNPISVIKDSNPVSAEGIDDLYSERSEKETISDLKTQKNVLQINTMGPSTKIPSQPQPIKQTTSNPSTIRQSTNSSGTCIGICLLVLFLGFLMQSCGGSGSSSKCNAGSRDLYCIEQAVREGLNR